MERRVLTPIGLALGALLISAFALLILMQPASAQTTPTPAATETVTATAEPSPTTVPTPVPEEPRQDRSVTVSGTGTVTATANVAQIYATVEVTGTSATEVLSETSQILEDVRGAVTSLGVSSDDVVTGPISVFPNVQPGDPEPDGYRASGSLSITVRDASQAGAVLEAATSAGADRANLFFTVEPDEELLDQAREEAFQNARRKAESLAALAGGTLGEVISISDAGALPPPIPAGGMGGAAEAAPSFAPGPQTTRVSLTVTWALE